MSDAEGKERCVRCGARSPGNRLCNSCWDDWKLYGDVLLGDGAPVTCAQDGCELRTAWLDGLCDDHGPAQPDAPEGA